MPRSLGRHELLVRLAAGGAANVFLVRDLQAPPPGRLLALKVLLPNLAENEDFLNMFFSEARIAARLRHPNIVRTAGFGRLGGIHCLAMEYVFGASLAQVLRASARARKPLTVGVLLRITAAVCDALHAAHEMQDDDGRPMGIVHRDVTPQNILVGFNGVPKLTDFGIAKATNRGWETQAGIVKGKFCYMSPEQALGKRVDRRSDIFCTGIVLWEALTGRDLFKGTSPMEVLEAIRAQKIVRPSKVVPSLSSIVDPIVMKALRRSTRQRYQTAADMRDDIEELIQRAGVTIDDNTISQEFAAIFGDVIVKRAFALRAAMAGRADLDELSQALGGQKLDDAHLPEMTDEEDEEDLLGLFEQQPLHDHSDDIAIGGALPAAPDHPFTAQFSQPNFDEPTHEELMRGDDDIEHIDGDDIELIEDIEDLEPMLGGAEPVDIDGWDDRTLAMEPSDELLSMLSEEDMTVGLIPAEFTARFGNALRPPTDDPVTLGDNQTADEDLQVAPSVRRARSVRPSGPLGTADRQGLKIPGQPTVPLARAKRAPSAKPSSRPVPRAPSLDLPEVVNEPPPDLRFDGDETGRDLHPLVGQPEAAPAPTESGPIRNANDPSTLPDDTPSPTLPLGEEPPTLTPQTGQSAQPTPVTPMQDLMEEIQLAQSSAGPLELTPLSGAEDAAAEDTAGPPDPAQPTTPAQPIYNAPSNVPHGADQVLRPGTSELSPEALRELASPDFGAAIGPSGPHGPAATNAPHAMTVPSRGYDPASGKSPQRPWLMLALAAALVTIGIGIGVLIVTFATGG